MVAIQMIDVSIILLTKNAGKQFYDTLKAIFSQNSRYKFEVIIIDSGSDDQTLKIAKEFNTKIFQINPNDFGHGKTRNYGATLAKGKFLIYLTQDAIPTEDDWLKQLLKPFSVDQVVGVYARQIPKPDASPFEQYFLLERYPDKAHQKQFQKILGPLKLDDIFFSNVCSAVRKKTLRRYPFDEQLIMSEDQQWAKDVLLAGYSIAYQPKATVMHSHNYNLKTVFRRFFDSGVSFEQMKKKGNFHPTFTKNGLKELKTQIQYMKKNGFAVFIPYALLYNSMKFLGLRFGMKNSKLPKWLNKSMSRHQYFWERRVEKLH